MRETRLIGSTARPSRSHLRHRSEQTASMREELRPLRTSAARPERHVSVFVPHSPSEAAMTVEQVLGPLIDYDKHKNTELVRSLQVFLQCNRSWKRATAKLFVHRQTLVYRMGRVEELTGRKLNETGDVAELWLALRAYRRGAAEGAAAGIG